jgi:hypothetical protein
MKKQKTKKKIVEHIPSETERALLMQSCALYSKLIACRDECVLNVKIVWDQIAENYRRCFPNEKGIDIQFLEVFEKMTLKEIVKAAKTVRKKGCDDNYTHKYSVSEVRQAIDEYRFLLWSINRKIKNICKLMVLASPHVIVQNDFNGLCRLHYRYLYQTYLDVRD